MSQIDFLSNFVQISNSEQSSKNSNVSKWYNKNTGQKVVIKKIRSKEGYDKEVNINNLLTKINIAHAIKTIDDEKTIIFEDRGKDLLSIVQNEIIEEYDLLVIFKNIFESLTKMHKQNIFHGDIKLENIVVDEKQTGYLIDFGLSEVLDKKKKSSKEYGSRFYIAPETTRKKDHDLKADVYALGITLYASLTGEFPFSGNTYFDYVIAQQTEEPNIELLNNAGVSEKTTYIIRRMLDAQPQARPTIKECYEYLYSNSDSFV